MPRLHSGRGQHEHLSKLEVTHTNTLMASRALCLSMTSIPGLDCELENAQLALQHTHSASYRVPCSHCSDTVLPTRNTNMKMDAINACDCKVTTKLIAYHIQARSPIVRVRLSQTRNLICICEISNSTMHIAHHYQCKYHYLPN
jgi:hypothetical protein